MSEGLLCDCPLRPLDGLKPTDRGHHRRPYALDQTDCPQYASDQERGGMCDFCRDAHAILTAHAAALREGEKA